MGWGVPSTHSAFRLMVLPQVLRGSAPATAIHAASAAASGYTWNSKEELQSPFAQRLRAPGQAGHAPHSACAATALAPTSGTLHREKGGAFSCSHPLLHHLAKWGWGKGFTPWGLEPHQCAWCSVSSDSLRCSTENPVQTGRPLLRPRMLSVCTEQAFVVELCL